MLLRLSTRTSSLAAAIGLLLSLKTTTAQAQACCAGIAAVTPARLQEHEIALVGLSAKGAYSLGADENGVFTSPPKGASEIDLEQDLFAAFRVLNRGQLAAMLPLLESRRTTTSGAGNTTDVGAGIGDLNLSARAEITRATYGSHVPAVALLMGVTLPTGRGPDAPNGGVLGARVTGLGAYQLNAGVAVEETIGSNVIASLSGIYAQRLATNVVQSGETIHELLAPQWTVLGAVAYLWSSGVSLGASGSYLTEGEPTLNGVVEAGFSRRSLTAALFVAVPINDRWRFSASVSDLLPISAVSQNQSSFPLGLSATIIKSWL